ncbi:MAG: HEAT repeat domain-containing protein [Planctomycetes bacterium]|nr:HEAT repeat domain-containing protein [Planctomycetota bacterium]
MRRVTATCLVLVLSGLAAAPALAHGGQYRGPGGRTPSDPTGPVAPPTSSADWEAWWAANAWKYIKLRERVRGRDAPALTAGGGLGAATGGQQPAAADPFDRRKLFEREVLPVMTDLLRDPDSEVRSAAAVGLGKMGFPRSILDLRKACYDEVRDVRDGAVIALGMLQDGFVLQDLEGILLDPAQQERTRSFAAVGIGLVGGKEASAILMDFLDPAADARRAGGIHRTPYTEAAALTALGFARDPDVIPALRRDYASGTRFEPQVRSFLAVTLARLGDREAIPFLLQGLEHAREPMRQSAAIALGILGRPGDDAVVKALAAASLGEKDINARQFALMGLSRIGGEEARAAVRRVLEKGPRIDLPLAALAVALGGDAEYVPVLRKRFREEKQPDLLGGFALALGLAGDREVAPDLRRLAFNQGDRGLRGYCLLALGLLDDRASVPDARKVVEEENDVGVKMAAATCLGLLQDPGAVPLLERMAKEGTSVYVRSSACRLLGEVGNPRSFEPLAAIAKDAKDNSVVRMSATAALGNLADRSLIPLLTQVGIDGNYASIVDPLIEIASIM